MVHTAAFLIAILASVSVQGATSSDSPMKASDLERAWRLFSKKESQSEVTATFPYGRCFKAAAQAHDLPEILLLAVARGESAFDPLARSSADAYGLMQILWPGTARHLGIKSREQLLDPCTNVDAGARYLRELLRRYGGNRIGHLRLITMVRTGCRYQAGCCRRAPSGTAVTSNATSTACLLQIRGIAAPPPAGNCFLSASSDPTGQRPSSTVFSR